MAEIWRVISDAWLKVLAGLGVAGTLVGLIPPVRQWLIDAVSPHYMAALLILLTVGVVVLGAAVCSLVRSRQRSAGCRPEGDVGTIDALGWPDAAQAMRTLAGRIAQHFHPDLVIGIDRGGSIVAGVLAKHLGIPSSTIASSTRWTISSPEGSLDDGIKDQRSSRRVVVVDDACRFGNTMRTAIEVLQRQCPSAEIKTAVILNLNVLSVGPSGPNRLGSGKPNPDYYYYWTKRVDVRLPWDPER